MTIEKSLLEKQLKTKKKSREYLKKTRDLKRMVVEKQGFIRAFLNLKKDDQKFGSN
jgi:hypothetical protein